MSITFLAFFALCITLCASGTIWIYDPEIWRHTPNVGLDINEISKDTLNLEQCQNLCIDAGYACLSFTWNGDVTSATATSTCRLYKTRFGFASGGLDQSDEDSFGQGGVALLDYKDGGNYFEKPVDLDDNLGDQLIANVLRLNGAKDYKSYKEQTNDVFNYEQYLMYYRAGIWGYVNNSETTSKYSVIMEYEVASAEECAMYCTRGRGLIDDNLGTRCISFNYHTDGLCHLLSFSLDGDSYLIDGVPSTAQDVKEGWQFYEALQGEGCWVVQGQCRKWDDDDWVSQQRKSYEVGVHVGVIREYATDEVCSKCFTASDYEIEFEYICLDKARTYHEDYCDNNADSGTVAYWGTDGTGVAEIWNSWDLTTGCVVDLTEFDCLPEQSKYSYPVPSPNTRFGGRIFRDSIGEEEFAAAVDKKRCWARGSDWYEYCELGGQGDGGQTPYLNLSWPSDGSWYLEPPIDCTCDEYGMKRESGFGMVREYCTRESTEPYCYRENQEDYWSEADLLCDDVTTGYEDTCRTRSASSGGTGCYLFYPQHTSVDSITYQCDGGGRYDFSDESFTEINDIKYHEVSCDEQDLNDCTGWSEEVCASLAKRIHESCANGLETESQQIVVWYRPTGDVMTYPSFAAPYETTVIRGVVPSAKYTVDVDDFIVDMMPIRNGRWMTFSPDSTKSGHLRQIDVWYSNPVDAVLTCTVWYGNGVTESIFLNQISLDVPLQEEADWVRFPIDNVTVTAGVDYTWQITSVTDDTSNLGDLGYVRGNGYQNGVGDMAWDYLFVGWIEGSVTSGAQLMTISIGVSTDRPWFEIWCIMLIVLFFIFAVFLCILHWKRKYDEDQERKEDRKFQAELRQRAMLQAEAERNARKGNVRQEYDDGASRSGSSRSRSASRTDDDAKSEPSEPEATPDDFKEEYDEEEIKTKQEQKNPNLLTPANDSQYDRVKSYSKNEMPGMQGGDGYQDPKKKKKKKRKKKRKKKGDDADDNEY